MKPLRLKNQVNTKGMLPKLLREDQVNELEAWAMIWGRNELGLSVVSQFPLVEIYKLNFYQTRTLQSDFKSNYFFFIQTKRVSMNFLGFDKQNDSD